MSAKLDNVVPLARPALRCLQEILDGLSTALTDDIIRTRPGWVDRTTGQPVEVRWVRWTDVQRILNREAPGWEHEIKKVKIGSSGCAVVGRVRFPTADFGWHKQESIGFGQASESGIKKADMDSMKRCCVKFGVALELYEIVDEEGEVPKQAATQGRAPLASGTAPPAPGRRPSSRPPSADSATAAQVSRIRAQDCDRETGHHRVMGALFPGIENPAKLSRIEAQRVLDTIEGKIELPISDGQGTNYVNDPAADY